MLAQRIADIEEKIHEACARAARSRDDVTLISVTKTQPAAVVNEAIRLGLVDIGENRVQEYLAKCGDLLPHHFHMIGHLQRNKVRQVIQLVTLLHSVDSSELAQEINTRAVQAGVTMDVLVEVNTSGESTKEGVHPACLSELAAEIIMLPGIRLRGLMTVAAYEEAERVRPSFTLLRTLLESLRAEFNDDTIRELSMGMTNDFEVAIEEGATFIRIGSAIFGPRA